VGARLVEKNRSQEGWNFARNVENACGFAQGEGKIRSIFEAFLKDFERFFAKMTQFRTIFCDFERKMSGFLQVGGRDYIDCTD